MRSKESNSSDSHNFFSKQTLLFFG